MNYTKLESGLFKCNTCGAEIKPLGFSGHFRIVHENFKMNSVIWNKGLDQSDDRIKAAAKKISQTLTGRKGRPHTAQSKKHLSDIAKARGFGGHTSKQRLFFKKVNGDVVYLQSSYEIEFAKILEDLKVDWHRPSPLKWIDDFGVEHRYYPDFKIGKVYVDTKNDYLIKKDSRKIELVIKQNNIDLRIVNLQSINKIYVQQLIKDATLV